MRPGTQRESIVGLVGRIECAIDQPAQLDKARGLALVAHPHPLFGGTLDNKVVQTLAKCFVDLGFVALRPNFRGVGATEGTHDEGRAEVDDLLCVLNWASQQFGAQLAQTTVLAGFSFGAIVQSHVAQRLIQQQQPAQRLVLIGTAAKRFNVVDVPTDTLVIHGECDETVPLNHVLDWARPQELPVVVIPGADHFFHGRLHQIRDIVRRHWLST